MKAISLRVMKDEMSRVLASLSSIRRQRIGLTPVWLSFDEQGRELTIGEQRGNASATVVAEGGWPPTGATVDLAHLRGAVAKVDSSVVELIMAEDAVIVPRSTGHVRLGLLPFGDAPTPLSKSPVATDGRRVGLPINTLPLFEWSAQKKQVDLVFIDFRGRPAVIGPRGAFALLQPGADPAPVSNRELIRRGRSFEHGEWLSRFERPFREASLAALVHCACGTPRRA